MSKALILILIAVFVLSSLVMVDSVFAPSTPRPSVPEFAVEYVRGTVEVRIKNQPFEDYYDDNLGNTVFFYYNIRVKRHTSVSWEELYNPSDGFLHQDDLSEYTEVSYSSSRWGYKTVSFPSGTQVDFQVEAMIGYTHRQVTGSMIVPWVFTGEISGWSETQTITVDDNYLSPVSTALVTEQQSGTLWSKTYGSGGAYDIIETSDGGYAVIGPSQESGGGYLLVKINSEGELLWQQTFSEDYAAYPKSIVGTTDGGYAIVGSMGHHIWLVKTDAEGNLQWEKTYGDGGGVSEANCLVETIDGGYAIVGDYASFTGLDGWEFLLVKTDSTGNLQWSKTYGKRDDDRANCIVRTNDGGYAIAGCTSRPGNTPLFWLVKTDANGNMQWSKNYTESLWNWAYSLVQTSDDGFALAGIASSDIGGAGSFWLVKTDSVGNMQWNKNFGNNADWVGSVIQTSDGGYALSGRDSNFQVVKTGAAGNLQWRYGIAGPSVGNAIIQARDGHYVIAGQYNLNDDTIITTCYFWVAKIGPDGEAPAGTQTPAVTPTPTFATPTPFPIPVPGESAFSVKSNSTVSHLFFNSTSSELSFTVTGPAGTAGYVEVTIAKSLVSSIQSVEVYLDGHQLNAFITEDVDAWLLSFTYLHSTHHVKISLGTNPASTALLGIENWIWIGVILIFVVVGAGLLVYFMKRKH